MKMKVKVYNVTKESILRPMLNSNQIVECIHLDYDAEPLKEEFTDMVYSYGFSQQGHVFEKNMTHSINKEILDIVALSVEYVHNVFDVSFMEDNEVKYHYFIAVGMIQAEDLDVNICDLSKMRCADKPFSSYAYICDEMKSFMKEVTEGEGVEFTEEMFLKIVDQISIDWKIREALEEFLPEPITYPVRELTNIQFSDR